ncbi:hypothetical protein ACWA1C_17165 [Flectobacillus roseus]
MEKHNIDKLFDERLQNYERKPRPEAWDKLQAKLQQNETKIVPLWWKVARAASVVILLGAAGYWAFHTNSETEISVAQKTSTTKQPSGDLQAGSQGSQMQSQLPDRIVPMKEVVAQKKSDNKNSWKTTNPKSGTLRVHQNPLVEPNKDLSENTLATVDPIQPVSKTNNTIVLLMEPSPEPASSPKTSETIVLAMVDAMDTGGTERPRPSVWTDELNTKKTSKFGKLWQQLKRAKNGEGVDWNELGVKPQKVLARADAKLENTKESIVESVKEIKNNEK